MTTIAIDWAEGRVTGRIAGNGRDGLLLAHGAGTNQDHDFIALLRDELARSGLTVLTFNYSYTERGAKRPDPKDKLIAVHQAAADALRERVDRMFLAGRSMGGRMGTYLAADGYPAAGLVLYAYPLHPAGKTDRLRIEQFPDISIPMLFFQGTRDALAQMDLFRRHIEPLPLATIEFLEGASHSPRGGGWTPQSTAAFLTERTTRWIGMQP